MMNKRPIHGGYPPVSKPDQRPIMLQIASADDAASDARAEWDAINNGDVDITSLVRSINYAAECAGWPMMSGSLHSRISGALLDPLVDSPVYDPVLALLRTGATIDQAGGNCPVQIEGQVDGHYFYFRARGEHWSFELAPTREDWADDRLTFQTSAEYGDGPYSAGWMPLHEAFGFVAQAIEQWRATKSLPPKEKHDE